jgi:hypothetical protein
MESDRGAGGMLQATALFFGVGRQSLNDQILTKLANILLLEPIGMSFLGLVFRSLKRPFLFVALLHKNCFFCVLF